MASNGEMNGKIKRIVSLLIAGAACLTAMMTPLTAYADKEDAKSDKKAEVTDKCKVKIKAVPPEEWQDEGHYEFKMTFMNASDKQEVYLDVDNKFRAEVDLLQYTPYIVEFSDDIDGYEIGGIDSDMFMTVDGTMDVVLSFRRKAEITEEVGGDGIISAENAEQLEEARKVVQKFISNTRKIGLDENDPTQWLLFQEKDNLKETFYHGSGKYYNRDAYKDLSETDAFYCYWLTYKAYNTIEPNDPDFDEDVIDEELEYFTDYDSTLHKYEGLRTAVGKEVKSVWMWLWDQYEETGVMPDLFVVYMDMKNNVEYEIEGGGETTTEEVTADETVSRAEKKIKMSLDSEDTDTISKMDFTSNKPEDINVAKNAKKRFGDIIKDNIGILILLVTFGGGLFLVKKIQKKAKEESEDD